MLWKSLQFVVFLCGTVAVLPGYRQANFSMFTPKSSQNASRKSNDVFGMQAPASQMILYHAKHNCKALSVTTDSDVITRIRKGIWSLSKTFNPAASMLVTTECKTQSQIFYDALGKFELWALHMSDSAGYLTSGILNGNINQFGDFDQCVNINSSIKNLWGQYCLAYLQPRIPRHLVRIRELYDHIQSHNAFVSNFFDPGHRIPRFSLINWALCIPSSCSALDAEKSLKEVLNSVDLLGLRVQVRVEQEMCTQIGNYSREYGKTEALFILFVIFVVCCFSTIYEVRTPVESQRKWFLIFSFKKNFKWLINVKEDSDDIAIVHGLRFINAIMLVFAHKSMAVFFNPYVNRTQLAEMLGQPWTVIGRAASLYTDPFLMFSALLPTYLLLGRLQKGQVIKPHTEYFGRFLRIAPPLVGLLLFCTFILPDMGSGPQWNLAVGYHSKLCKKYWWRNLLFIHNYFGFENMCLTHTHHIGIDTQLFIITPLAVISLWKWPKKTLTALCILVFVTTILRLYTTTFNELSNYVYFGATIPRLFKTADYMYTSALHRSSVYMLGILLGYALRMYKTIKLSSCNLYVGWLICTLCFFGTLFAPAAMGNRNYVYSPLDAGCYAAFAPFSWCFVFIWMILTSHLGYKNSVTNFLSWRGFKVATKLSYAIYLTQFPVFFFNVGRRRSAEYYNFFEVMFNINELLFILIASIALTLMFDVPFKNIKTIYLK